MRAWAQHDRPWRAPEVARVLSADVRQYGFVGLSWLITISAVLQTVYNMENARFTLATGEVPIVSYTRTPRENRRGGLLVIYPRIWGG
jgi:hypothetical protein